MRFSEEQVENLIDSLNKESIMYQRENAILRGLIKAIKDYLEVHPTDTILYNKILHFLGEQE